MNKDQEGHSASYKRIKSKKSLKEILEVATTFEQKRTCATWSRNWLRKNSSIMSCSPNWPATRKLRARSRKW